MVTIIIKRVVWVSQRNPAWRKGNICNFISKHAMININVHKSHKSSWLAFQKIAFWNSVDCTNVIMINSLAPNTFHILLFAIENIS